MAVGDDADEGVGTVTGLFQLGKDGFDVLFDEEKVGDDDVGFGDGLFCVF